MSLFLCRFTKRDRKYMNLSEPQPNQLRLVDAENEEDAAAKLIAKLTVDDPYGCSVHIEVDEVTGVLR